MSTAISFSLCNTKRKYSVSRRLFGRLYAISILSSYKVNFNHRAGIGSYCSQSSRYSTATTASKLLDIEPVLEAARKAKANGSTRFCMGAAWRDLAGRKRGFERILTMVREVRGMGMEVCTTLGMLSPEQAKMLKEASVFSSLAWHMLVSHLSSDH